MRQRMLEKALGYFRDAQEIEAKVKISMDKHRDEASFEAWLDAKNHRKIMFEELLVTAALVLDHR
jgi:hypothetical protein